MPFYPAFGVTFGVDAALPAVVLAEAADAAAVDLGDAPATVDLGAAALLAGGAAGEGAAPA